MERLQETGPLMGRLMKDMPEQLKQFGGFVKIAEADGAIDEKTKHLDVAFTRGGIPMFMVYCGSC